MFPTYLLWTAAALSPAGAIIRRARLRSWLSGRRKIWPRLPRVEASSRLFSELLKDWHRRKSLCANSLLDSKFDRRLEDNTPMGPSSGPLRLSNRNGAHTATTACRFADHVRIESSRRFADFAEAGTLHNVHIRLAENPA